MLMLMLSSIMLSVITVSVGMFNVIILSVVGLFVPKNYFSTVLTKFKTIIVVISVTLCMCCLSPICSAKRPPETSLVEPNPQTLDWAKMISKDKRSSLLCRSISDKKRKACRIGSLIVFWGQGYKTFYGCNLQTPQISNNVYPWQCFPA